MKNIAITASLVCIGALAQGCLSQATVGDTTQQDCDRQNQIASTLKAQYEQVAGLFVGTYNNSTVFLNLDVPSSPTTGAAGTCSVPQPSIQGNLAHQPPISVTDISGKPMKVYNSVTGGEYVNGNDLSLIVSINNASTTLHCQVSNQNDNLDCEWYVGASNAPSENFQLRRSTTGQASSSDPGRTQGKYVGSDQYYKDIEVTFDIREEAQGASGAIPVETIGGRITKDGVPTALKDGLYDPITSTLVFSIQGSNNPEMNCVVLSATSLRCEWFGRQGNGTKDDTGQNEVFELTKSSL